MTKYTKQKAGLFFLSTLVSAFFLGGPALAQAPVSLVPSPAPLPQVPLVSSQAVQLTPKESYGLKLAAEWKNHPDRPRRGQDGSVVYLYGATLPVMICTPLEVCAIKLQPGEIVNDVNAGDIARWRINPATSGTGTNATTYIVVKPTDAGLTTDLFVTTNKRNYTIKLVSDQHDWIPVLSFDYPSDLSAAWAAYHQQETAAQQAAAATYARNTIPATGQNLSNLDFNYTLTGDQPGWMPLRVYTDGQKTYIQFPGTGFPNGAPALVELGKGSLFESAPTEIVNYRVVGNSYVVDQVLQHAALISGVGSNEERVVITHEGD